MGVRTDSPRKGAGKVPRGRSRPSALVWDRSRGCPAMLGAPFWSVAASKSTPVVGQIVISVTRRNEIQLPQDGTRPKIAMNSNNYA